MLVIRNYNLLRLLSMKSLKRKFHSQSIKSVETKVEEIKIPVAWGHIAGKWYNRQSDSNIPPLLFMHGWLDNSGTFDRLMELFPQNFSCLCIDFPGHGHSTWLPHGMYYHGIDFVAMINLIMKEYNWRTISIIGHSLGSLTGFIFSSLYPEKVNMYIALDPIKPMYEPNEIAKGMELFNKTDERNRVATTKPPCYTIQELCDLYYTATFTSVKKEYAHHIFQRNVAESTTEPGKYYFIRDNRIKYYYVFQHSEEYFKILAKRLVAPKLILISTQEQNPVYRRAKDNFQQIIDDFNENTYIYHIDGTHHVHLNEPSKIIDKVYPFIMKHHKFD